MARRPSGSNCAGSLMPKTNQDAVRREAIKAVDDAMKDLDEACARTTRSLARRVPKP